VSTTFFRLSVEHNPTYTDIADVLSQEKEVFVKIALLLDKVLSQTSDYATSPLCSFHSALAV
jgi:hypothetical protein